MVASQQLPRLKATAHGTNENANCLHLALKKIHQCADDARMEIVQNPRAHAR
jgi:hypothetical protein